MSFEYEKAVIGKEAEQCFELALAQLENSGEASQAGASRMVEITGSDLKFRATYYVLVEPGEDV